MDLSWADTFTMPMASMSRVASIRGTPRGAGGIPSRRSLPKSTVRSPSTWIKNVWLAVSGGGEDRCVAPNQLGHDSTCCLPAHGPRRNTQQQQHLHLGRLLTDLMTLLGSFP